MRSATAESVRFPKGVRQALAWAISVASRNGYVSPGLSRMMGSSRETAGGLTLLEKHGDAAYIIGIVERMPEIYQAVIWLRASVLPQQAVEDLARILVPHITRQLPTGIYNRAAVFAAILKTTGKGPGIRHIRQELKISTKDASDWVNSVAEKVDALGRVAEAELEREMEEKGWI